MHAIAAVDGRFAGPALRAARALQVWRAAIVVMALSKRLTSLQAVLETEREIKRRQFHEQQLKQRQQRAKETPLAATSANHANGHVKGQHRQRPPSARSALDKLFAVLDVWESGRLGPALWAWEA